MTHKAIAELSLREREMLRICSETGAEYMASRWTYINSRIIAELPNATVSEGISTQLNAGIRDISALVVNLIDYSIAHNLSLGTPEAIIEIINTQMKDVVAEMFENRKRIMI